MGKKDVKQFTAIEKSLALFEREYAGFPYWQYLRFSLCESLFGNGHCIGKQIHEKSDCCIIKRLLFMTVDVLKDIRLLILGGKCDIIVFKERSLKNKFFDYWQIPENIKTYNFRTNQNPEECIIKEHRFGIPKIFIGLTCRLAKLQKEVYDEKERAFLITLEDKLKKQFGQSMSYNEMEKIILHALKVHQCYKKYFERIFDKMKCKAILTIVYYQMELYPAYEIAKKKGIKIIEFQHGVINNHESYWFDDQRGINNYTPDYLLTYGEIHNQWIKLVNGSKAVSVGFPYQEYIINTLKEIKPKNDTVIVYPDSFPDFERVIDQFINQYKQYNVIIKLHPLQAGHALEYFPLLSKNKNAKFINSQDKSIYYWLKSATHHVMASTTVGLEAMAFDHCNVCIIESVPHEQTQCLLEWGVARGFKTAEELADLIQNPIEDKSNLQTVRERLWKRKGKENIESFIRNLIERE